MPVVPGIRTRMHIFTPHLIFYIFIEDIGDSLIDDVLKIHVIISISIANDRYFLDQCYIKKIVATEN